MERRLARCRVVHNRDNLKPETAIAANTKLAEENWSASNTIHPTRDWMGRIIAGKNTSSKDSSVMNTEAKEIMNAFELAMY